jgi:hypothetical protein
MNGYSTTFLEFQVFKKRKGEECMPALNHFFGFSEAFGAALFAGALTFFIGSWQQINSQVSSHSQGLSTITTRPHSSHVYCSPFFFTKKSPSKNR